MPFLIIIFEDAVVEEASPFKAIFNKKSQPKAEEIEEENDEEDLEEDLEEGDDFGDEELPEGVDEILEADELAGDELEEEEEEGDFDEEELGELEARPQGFIGYGNEPDPEDEYAFEEAMAADV